MFRRSIAQTLFIVITLLAFVVVAGMAGLFRNSLQSGFRAYVQAVELARLEPLASRLLERYAEAGSWDFLAPGEDLGAALQRERMAATGDPGNHGPQPWRGRAGGNGNGFGGPQGLPPPPGFGPPPGMGPDMQPGMEQGMEQGMAPEAGPGPLPGGEAGAGLPAANDRGGMGPAPARHGRRPPGMDTLALGQRAALLDAQGRYLAGNRAAGGEPRKPLYHGTGEQRRLVGYLVLTEPPAAQRQAGEDFVSSQLRNLAGISLLVLALSAAAAFGLAAYFRRPLAALGRGTQRIAAGDLAARLPEDRGDELGRLAVAFNRMAEKLQAFETSRRQWMADTSHELRTPLTVLATHLEAMRDGVIPPSPEKLQALSRTVADMNRLVDDLHQLASAEAGAQDYRYEALPVADLLAELEAAFAPRLQAAGLAFKVSDGTPAGTRVRADHLRLLQVLGNLLGNSARYTDAGGEVLLTALRWQDQLQFTVEDSAPGVPPLALKKLFERFYRVDASRSRQGGGSGLGLAICRAIVQAHGGRIQAMPSVLGGLKVVVTLPEARAEGGGRGR